MNLTLNISFGYGTRPKPNEFIKAIHKFLDGDFYKYDHNHKRLEITNISMTNKYRWLDKSSDRYCNLLSEKLNDLGISISVSIEKEEFFRFDINKLDQIKIAEEI